MNDDGMLCKCYGADRRTRCVNDATQEDGLCDTCRCPHGGCDHHGDDATFRADLWYEDPLTWVSWFGRAQSEMMQCRGIKIYEEVKQDEDRREHADGDRPRADLDGVDEGADL